MSLALHIVERVRLILIGLRGFHMLTIGSKFQRGLSGPLLGGFIIDSEGVGGAKDDHTGIGVVVSKFAFEGCYPV